MLKRKQESTLKEKFVDLTKRIRFYNYKKRNRNDVLSSGSEKPKEKRERESPRWQDLDLETDETDESISVIVQLDSTSDVPTRGTDSAAAYDLCAKSNAKLEPGKVTKVPLKLQLAIPPSYFMWIAGRSGLAAQGILAHNGIIDPDYRGEIAVLLHNTTGREFQVMRGQRVAQAIILPVIPVLWKKTDTLSPTQRNEGGFGSSGRT